MPKPSLLRGLDLTRARFLNARRPADVVDITEVCNAKELVHPFETDSFGLGQQEEDSDRNDKTECPVDEVRSIP